MHRKGPRFTRILAACAAVPVILTAAACSSGSDSGDGEGKGKSSSGSKSSASPSGKDDAATVQKAAFDTLPEACKTLSGKTVEQLVPEVDNKSGKSAKSEDMESRGSCSWNGLDSNGTKGSQFRWMNVSLLRYDSNATLGSGDKLAAQQLTKKVDGAKTVKGAKSVKTEPLKGIGDEATLIRYDLEKKEGDFKNHRIVARIENAVVVLDYNGAGLAGAGDPSSEDMVKDAKKAAEEAVESVESANKSAKTSDSPSDKSSDTSDSSGSSDASDSSDSADSSSKSKTKTSSH